jgi:crossover junction endodeoxyribonuclease RusA
VRDKSTEAIIIDLPLPPDCLHPNARVHWAQRAKATKQCRELACLMARQVRPKKPFKAANYRLTFWLARKRDYDGLQSFCKAYVDGLQDGGIIENDSEFRPAGIVRYSGKKQTGGKIGVRFEIFPE